MALRKICAGNVRRNRRNMKKRKWSAACVCMMLSVLPFSGCGQQKTTEYVPNTAVPTAMEETPVIDYSLPALTPNVLVDRYGYGTEEKKEAVLKGKRLPKVFSLVDAESGETVYSGRVTEVVYLEKQEIYVGTADFSQADVTGRVYLRCAYIGESYPFWIEDDFYQELFGETCEELLESCRSHTLETEEAVTLLQAYEWYPDIFPDENKNEIPDILEELKEWVAYREENGVSASEEALYAAFLAKFSYTYQKFSFSYATDCLKRASTVFGQVQNTLNKSADIFCALAELYRATGLQAYGKQLLEYESYFTNNSTYLEETAYLYGAMTYLVTRQKVDMDLCDIIMKRLMERAEEISSCYEEMIHPVTARNDGSEDLLKNARIVSCANYCMNNYQYTNIGEDFLHYLMGCNLESVDFYGEAEQKTGYLLLLAQLVGKNSSFKEK